MHGFLPIFFLMVVLKIPVGLLLYIVWWAFRAETQPEEAPPDSGGHGSAASAASPSGRAVRAAAATAPMRCRCPECPPGGRTRVVTEPAPVRARAR